MKDNNIEMENNIEPGAFLIYSSEETLKNAVQLSPEEMESLRLLYGGLSRDADIQWWILNLIILIEFGVLIAAIVIKIATIL